jgi:hypothetical protein
MTYLVAPDADKEPTLWQHWTEVNEDVAIARKRELDRLDPVLWTTLVAALTTADKVLVSADEVRDIAEVYLYDGDTDQPHPGYTALLDLVGGYPDAPTSRVAAAAGTEDQR